MMKIRIQIDGNELEFERESDVVASNKTYDRNFEDLLKFISHVANELRNKDNSYE